MAEQPRSGPLTDDEIREDMRHQRACREFHIRAAAAQQDALRAIAQLLAEHGAKLDAQTGLLEQIADLLTEPCEHCDGAGCAKCEEPEPQQSEGAATHAEGN